VYQRSIKNPLEHAFEMLGQAPESVTDSINSEALESLTQALTVRAEGGGRMVLLRAPRAGFGKTHLLGRLHQRVAHTHEFIPLEPIRGRSLYASEVLEAVLRRFSRVVETGKNLTVLDLLARRIFAIGLEPLVGSGEVPSQDLESALEALRIRPVETFDFHDEDAATARWAKANFNLLGSKLTAELAGRTGSSFRTVAWWVDVLFRYSAAPLDQTARNSVVFQDIFGSESAETDMHEKLVTLFNLMGLVTSPVLILDEVEGFSGDPGTALEVATFLNSLHQSCNKLAIIISTNGDIWETAFLPRLPCGLKDRLSDIVIDLTPMTQDQATELLRDRVGANAEAILETMDLDVGVIYARGLIREASEAWVDLGLGKVSSGPSTPGNHSSNAPISLAQSLSDEDEESVNPTNQDSSPSTVLSVEAPIPVVSEVKENAEMEERADYTDTPVGGEPGASKLVPESQVSTLISSQQGTSLEQEESDSSDLEDQDKVGKLLRQFRDRYGRKS